MDDLPQGKRLPIWANQKVARAQAHALELKARVDSWLASNPIEPVAEIAEDRLSWTLRLKVNQAPPFSEWSLILGDFVHNLRTSFDALVWDLSAVQAGDPGVSQIQFPIVADATKWEEVARRRLRGVEDLYVGRIRELQPLNQTEAEQAGNPLAILNDLDILDKHRAGLTAIVKPRNALHAHEIEFHTDEAAARNVPPQATLHEPRIADGAILIESTTVDPIVKVRGDYQLTFEIHVDTPVGPVPLYGAMDSLAQNALLALNFVMNGQSDDPVVSES
jgi:hypothetical protein